jgi:hypothetical protein
VRERERGKILTESENQNLLQTLRAKNMGKPNSFQSRNTTKINGAQLILAAVFLAGALPFKN